MLLYSSSTNLCLFLGRHSGVESGLWVYGRSLLEGLAEHPDLNGGTTSISCIYAGPGALEVDLAEIVEDGQGRITTTNRGGGIGRRFGLLADLLSSSGAVDLVHGTANTLPVRGRAKKVLTLHDLLQAYPVASRQSFYQRLKSLWYRVQLRMLVGRVDLILTDHQSTCAKILDRFAPVCPVKVVYPGLTRGYTEAPLPSEKNESNTFLAFASLDPRKNIKRTLVAFRMALAVHPELRLMILAGDHEVAGVVAADVERMEMISQVEVRAGVPGDQMPELYRNSRGVLFASLAEGFGYPIYEALSQGTPVVCDADLVAPEAMDRVGTGIVGCDPYSEDSIYRGILRVIEIPQEPDWRAGVAGFIRGSFNFDQSARKVVSLYRDLLER